MTWLKSILSFSPVIVFVLFAYLISHHPSVVTSNPNNSTNYSLSQLNKYLILTKIPYTIKNVDPNLEEVYVNITGTNVIFSLHASAYSQVANLQNFLKTANIKGKVIQFIDLSSSHPYATFSDH